MTKRRIPFRRMLLATGLASSILIVVLNVASALGASEPFKDAIVTVGLIGMLLAPVIVAWKGRGEG